MFILCPIQSTLNSPSREFVLFWVVGIVDRYFVSVIKTGFRSVAFFLLQILNSVSRTQCLKLSSQLPKWYLNKVLVIGFTNVYFLLDTWIVTNYQFTYLVFKTMVNYQSSSLVQIVSNAITTPLVKLCLLASKRFYTFLY